MKKIKNLVLIVLFLGISFLLTGCGTKTPITSDDFKSKMEDKEFVVQDATSQMSQYEYIKKVSIALKSDSSYQIEFYELDSEDNAKKFYKSNKKIFEDSIKGTVLEKNVNLKNNDKYTLTTDGKYKVLSRIDKTVIYLNVDDSNKKEINEILKYLGY